MVNKMENEKVYWEEYVKINGIDQYFLHYPSLHKTVLLHLHGGPGGSEALTSYYLHPHVKDFCTLVYYDQRGAGKTQIRIKSKPDDLSLEVLLADLQQSIAYIKKKHETDQIILLGHSWGSVLGTQYILRHPEDITAYIGYGQVVDMKQGEKLGYEKLREKMTQSGATKDLKKLNNLGDYPNGVKDFNKAVLKFRKLQRKHGFMEENKLVTQIMSNSPLHFGLWDIFTLLRIVKLNRKLRDTLLQYSVWDTTDYPVPVYYILGKNDWITPSTLAEAHFRRINAPQKGLYWIENTEHHPELANPAVFGKAIREILQG